MAQITRIDNLDEPVTRHMRTDFIAISTQMNVQQALDSIRSLAVTSGNIVYFYVVDADGRLAGVIQTRKLLTAGADSLVDSIMTKNVITIPDSFTLLDACEYFVIHKFLAFPIVDSNNRIVGVVDIELFTEEVFDIEAREEARNVFETLGVRISELRDKSAWHVFRYRFPWILATITSGTVCALLVGLFEVTLAKSLILASFLTLMLGLGESVAMQTMAITLHLLHHQKPQHGWYVRMLRRELSRTFLVGVASAFIVFCIAVLWRKELLPGVVIACGIVVSLLAACFLGVSIPTLFHRLKLDVRLASGPVTLALADICTVAAYFSLAALLLS